MDAMQGLVDAFAVVLQPEYLLWAIIGVTLGTFVGVLPGIGAVVTMSLLLPIVFALGDPLGAIIMFAGIFYGSMYGSSTAAILVSTPGDSASIVTVLDGYRMALSGRAGAALLTAAVGSFVAGILATLGLAFLAVPLARVALSIGPAEYFAICVFAFSAVSMLGGKPLKAAFSALLGLAIGTVGIHSISGTSRFTYGVIALYNGIDFEVVAMGMFALVEVMLVVGTIRLARAQRTVSRGRLYMTKEEWKRSSLPWLRGSGLGFLVGIIPGPGATVASFLSYGVERGVSKTPEKFGRGSGMIEGLAGPEAANNAAAGGSMVPLLTLGIPGSASTAVMLGALQGFGVPTGPLLLRDSPELVWAVVASLLIGNLMLLVLNVPLIRVWVAVLKVPPAVLYPIILVICSVGVFTLSRNAFDLVIMLGFAVAGLLLRLTGFPLAIAVLGLILGPVMEEQWDRALTISNGDWSVFVSSPTAIIMLTLAGLVFLVPVVLRVLGATKASRSRSLAAALSATEEEA